jgi:hypothetical protein
LIRIITYEHIEGLSEDITEHLITVERPLVEIISFIRKASSNDVIILASGLETKETIENIIKLYIFEMPVMSFSIDEIKDNSVVVVGCQKNYMPDDTVVFTKRYMRNGIKDLSVTSNYNRIREKIIRLCGGGTLYVSKDRMDNTTQPIIYPISNNFTSYPQSRTMTNKSDVYKVKINLGVGDILYARAILDGQKNMFKKVYISPNFNVFNKQSSPTKSDIEFTNTLLQMIFKPPYYNLDLPNLNYPEKYAYTFNKVDRFPLLKPNLEDTLCDGKPLKIGPYILISTRVREISINEYTREIKDKLMDLLEKLSKKYMVVVIGERDLLKNCEYSFLKDRMFTIYDDIKSSIKADRLVDLTFQSWNNINNDRMTSFKQDCLYMRDADWNITLGNGGNFCMATSVGKVIGYYTKKNPIDATPLVFKNTSYAGIHITDDLTEFFNKLKSLLDTKPVRKMTVNMGVGDLVLIKSMLDCVKDRYSNIYISPNTSFFDDIRTKDYKNGMIKEYIEYLFGNDPFYILDDKKYERRNTETLFWNDKILFKGPQGLNDRFCIGEPLNVGKYVTVTTKIRSIKKSTYTKIKDNFLKSLLDLSYKYKVVILGERDLPNWPEYKNELSDNVYVIYDDIINALPKENIVDMSYNTNTNTLKNLQQDCLYMKNAYYNITIGMGGGFCLTLLSGNVLGFWEQHASPDVAKLYNIWVTVKSNAYLTTDIDKFIYWLGEL